MPLTDTAVRRAKSGAKPARFFDGGGMYLQVSKTGAKYWRLKYRFGGKEKVLALGVYPDVSLAKARRDRDEARGLLAEGVDPGEHRKAERAAKRADEDRQLTATRFMLGNDGGLSFRLGRRCLAITPTETAELRAFLDATRGVSLKESPCP